MGLKSSLNLLVREGGLRLYRSDFNRRLKSPIFKSPIAPIVNPATSATVQSAAFETAIHPPKVGKFPDRPIHCNNPTNHCNSACRRPNPDG